MKNKRFSCDFETVTWLENETYVWAWSSCEIGNENNIIFDNNIDSFFEFCKKQYNPICYFHNLKFDGEFIIYWLEKHFYKHVRNRKDAEDKTYTTLISDMGQFYEIEVYFKKKEKKVKKVTFIDSLKIIPFSVKQMSKAFGLEEEKGELDYNLPRKKGHKLTEEEINYIRRDVQIVSHCLNVVFSEGLTKMTNGANSLQDFKNIFTKRKFEHFFPELTKAQDKDIRQAYRGGFTYLNPLYKEKDVENVTILDVNSLYPSVMRGVEQKDGTFKEYLYPWGEPIFFIGKYKKDETYPLYVQMITCSFEIKTGMIPTIQIKNNTSFFLPNEYLESSNGEIVALCLTSVDFELFLKHYNVFDLQFVSGWKFKAGKGFFNEYIDKWTKRKIQAGKEGNKGQRQLSKLRLNSLYGKFATSIEAKSKIPYLGEDDIIHYFSVPEERKGLYLPVGIFITSYARRITIETSQKIRDYSINRYGIDMYIYSDTDSIHTLLLPEELEQFCDIDDYKLGWWANEGFAVWGRFIRQKCYEELKYNEKENRYTLDITCAGMPKTCINFNKEDKKLYYKDFESGTLKEFKKEDFKVGFSCGNKLTFKHVKGGVKLVETEFTIKGENQTIGVVKNLI